MSQIDDMVSFIEESGGVLVQPSWSQETVAYFEHPYKLEVLGTVSGMGITDTGDHEIRRLEYKDKVWLEKMERHPDCDCDDVIRSYHFNKEEEPENWEIEDGQNF